MIGRSRDGNEMAPTILLDSNLLIYAPRSETVRRFIGENFCAASAISLVEVLGFHQLSAEDILDYERLFAGLDVIPVAPSVIDAAITLRRQRKMKLGDSLIAATALENDLPLATNNESDFRWINRLRLMNPLKP